MGVVVADVRFEFERLGSFYASMASALQGSLLVMGQAYPEASVEAEVMCCPLVMMKELYRF